MRKIIFTALLAAALRLHAGCNLSWQDGLASPYPGVDMEGHVRLKHTLTTLRLPRSQGGEFTIPIRAYWQARNAADTGTAGGYLGAGWTLPLLESSCRPTGPETYALVQPDGYAVRIRAQSTGKDTAKLSGYVWSGTRHANKEIHLQAACGDRLVFDAKGRIKEATLDQLTCEWVWQANRLGEIRSGDTTLIRFEYDDQGRISRYTCRDESALLRYAEAPVSLVAGQPQTAVTLADIRDAKGATRRYEFSLDAKTGRGLARIPESPEAEWELGSSLLRRLGTVRYTITPHPDNIGGAEFDLRDNDVRCGYFYNDVNSGTRTTFESADTLRKEVSITQGPAKGKTRSISLVKNGVETMLEKNDYDMNGDFVHGISNGKELINKRNKKGDVIECTTASSSTYFQYDKRSRQIIRRQVCDEGETEVIDLTIHSDHPDYAQAIALLGTEPVEYITLSRYSTSNDAIIYTEKQNSLKKIPLTTFNTWHKKLETLVVNHE